MRLLIAAAGIAAAALVAAPLASAEPVPGGQISDVTSKPGSVQFVFSTDYLAAGQNLDPKSLVVSAGGVDLPATVSAVPAGAPVRQGPPRAIMLTLDVSGSMAGTGINGARSAALSYAKSLPTDIKVGLLTFNQKPSLLLAPTTDRIALTSAITKVKAGGSTALYDGLVASAAAMNVLPDNTIKRLLVLSDGADTSSAHSISDVTTTLSADVVAADVVAFRLPGDRKALTTIATASHGKVLPAASASDLASTFAAAAKAFSQRVLVTAQIPASVASKHEQLTVTMNGGGQTITAVSSTDLPAALAAPATQHAPVSTAGAVGGLPLWLVCALAFVAMMVCASILLLGPVMRAERASKQSRLDEVGRYRMIGAVDQEQAAAINYAAPAENALTTRALAVVDKAVRARGQRSRIVTELERSGLRMRPEEWAALQLAAIITGSVGLAFLMGSALGLFIGAGLAWGLCRLFISRKISKRAMAFDTQLPDALQLLAGSLRSGFALNQAIGGLVREGTEPIAGEFGRALTEVRLGSDLDDALDAIADRMNSYDMHLVVMAIRTAREVGGNLAEILGNTVATMRERVQLRGQVRVLSSEGRLSAVILVALPFVLAGYLALFKPDYLTPLFSTFIGMVLLTIGAVLLIVGSLWLKKLVKIEV